MTRYPRRIKLVWICGAFMALGLFPLSGCFESNPQPSPVVAADTTARTDTTAADGAGGDDTSLPPADAGADVACVPDCAEKECGDDGCGGLCGTCEDGQYCEAGGCYWLMCSPGGDPWCDGDK